MIIKISCVLLSIVVTTNAQLVEEDSVPEKTCYTSDGVDGVCVSYYLCRNGKIITDGSDLFDIRKDGTCQDYFESCCVPEDRHVRNLNLGSFIHL